MSSRSKDWLFTNNNQNVIETKIENQKMSNKEPTNMKSASMNSKGEILLKTTDNQTSWTNKSF